MSARLGDPVGRIASSKHYFARFGARDLAINTTARMVGSMRVISILTLLFSIAVAGGTAQADRWDSKGWVKFGERTVNGRVDTDRIAVGSYKGKFQKLTLVVTDSDLELIDLEVKFERGPAWHPALRHYFKEGQRSHVIDFPGDERRIKFVEMKYKNLAGGGAAKVQVWAK